MKYEEFCEEYKGEKIVKRQGRFGVYYYTIQSQTGDYQQVGKISCDSVEDVKEKINRIVKYRITKVYTGKDPKKLKYYSSYKFEYYDSTYGWLEVKSLYQMTILKEQIYYNPKLLGKELKRCF